MLMTGLEREPIRWIESNLDLRQSDTVEFWYDQMESQSGRALPVLYQPFDGRRRSHFVDRGQVLDFGISAGAGRLLDFGPGDGWPSLLLAPMVDEVVGVDGSRRRVEVCRLNASRLGAENASFEWVPVGALLPFEGDSFDGVTAASSVEQTPDPRATLRELYRVLKPGGRLRMRYESLGYYEGRDEREVNLMGTGDSRTRLTILDRNVEREHVRHFGLTLDLTTSEAKEMLAPARSELSYSDLTPEGLDRLSRHLLDAVSWTLQHPSCRTLLAWLGDVGFSSAMPTHDGGWFAGSLFDRLPDSSRPTTARGVDQLLRPLVEIVTTMEAPAASRVGEWDPWITAVK